MELGTTMKMNRFALLGAVLTTLVLASSIQAAGKYYKWVDAAGVVHYGENPPDPSKAQLVNVKVGSSRDEAVKALEESRAQAEAQSQQATADAEQNKVSEENAKIVEENCKIYKQNLSALKNSARIREKDEKGEYRYLTDEEKAARENTAATYIKENCK